MTLPLRITGLDTTVAPVGPFQVSLGAYTAISQPTSDNSTWWKLDGSSWASIAQSFLSPYYSISINTIQIQLCKVGTPTDNLSLQIRDNSTNALIATSQNVSGTFVGTGTPGSSSVSTVAFNFSPNVTLSPSTTYRMEIHRSVTDGTNYYAVNANNSGPYANGQIYYSGDGTTFSPSTGDLIFYITEAGALAYYLFGRDATTATTLQVLRSRTPDTVVTLDQPTGGTGVLIGTITANAGVGQTVTPTQDLVVTTASFWLQKFGSPTDNYYVEIRAWNSPTVVLATSSTLAASGVGSSGYTQQDFTFSSYLKLSAGVKYIFLLRRSGAVNASNYLYAEDSSSDPYSGGAETYFDSSGNSYTESNSGYDLRYSFAGHTWFSTSPDTSFSTGVQALGAYNGGSVIYLSVIDGSGTSCNLKYREYDAVSGVFQTSETVQAGFNPQDNASANTYGCAIAYRASDGQCVILYNGARVASMSQSYSRIVYARRTATNTWTTNVAVDAGGTINCKFPEIVPGSSNRLHFFWTNVTTPSLNHRTLTSANALGTAGAVSAITGTLQGVSYVNGANTVVRVSNGPAVYGFNSADSPGFSAAIGTINLNADSMISQMFVDINGATITLAAFQHNASDGDLYVNTSANDGSTWLGNSAQRVGTVTAMSDDGATYTRNNAVVAPVVYLDGTAYYYDEYLFRSLSTPVTVTPTGSSAAASVGTAVVPTPISFAVTGNAAAASTQSVTAAIPAIFAVTGNTAPAATQSSTVNTGVTTSPTGSAIAAATQTSTVLLSAVVSPTGNAAAAATQSVTASITSVFAVTGNSAAAAIQSAAIATGVTISPSGFTALASATQTPTILLSAVVSPTGNAAASAIGTVSVPTIANVTGVALSIQSAPFSTTWNPADQSGVTLSNGNLSAQITSATGWIRSIMKQPPGSKSYFEITITANPSGTLGIGIQNEGPFA